MTVKELILKLQHYPENADVHMDMFPNCGSDVRDVFWSEMDKTFKHKDVIIMANHFAFGMKSKIYTNEDKYIIPGLGDAGDRIFGTKWAFSGNILILNWIWGLSRRIS